MEGSTLIPPSSAQAPVSGDVFDSRKPTNGHDADQAAGMSLRAVDARWGDAASKWVWSTGPFYVFEEDGAERVALEPVDRVRPRDYSDEKGWWTCDKRTKVGDLAAIYRAGAKNEEGCLPKRGPKDLRYIVLATSDAFPLKDDPLSGEFAKHHGCRFVVVRSLSSPVRRFVFEFSEWRPPSCRLAC